MSGKYFRTTADISSERTGARTVYARIIRGLFNRSTFTICATWVLFVGYAPFAYADDCTVNAPSTISLIAGGSSTFGVTCSVDTCNVTTSSLPVGDLTIAPTQWDVGTTEKIFNVASTRSAGSVSLFVAWACPNPTGFTEDSRTVEIISPPETNNGDNGFAGEFKDPISTFNGELYNQFQPDISLGGPLPLTFSRYYGSRLGVTGFPISMAGRWRNNFEWRMEDFAKADKKTFISPLGRTISFVNSGGNWVLSGKTDVPFQLGQQTQFGPFTLFDPRSQLMYEFEFSVQGRLSSISDSNGNTHTLTYDGTQIISVSDGLGRILNFTFDAVPGGKLISVDDGQGRSVGFAYILNPSGFGFLLDSVTDMRGMTTTFAYELDNLMTSSTRPAGNTPFSQTWNASGQVVTQIDAAGHTYSLSYAGPETTMTDPLGNSRKHTHTVTAELSSSEDQEGNVIVIGSDATGRRNSVVDRLGDVTSHTFDTLSGSRSGTTHADGSSDSVMYSPRTNGVSTVSDVSGITRRDGSTSSFTYDTSGNLTSSTDQLGNVASTTFNANGLPLSSTNRAGAVTVRTFNSDETLASRTDASGNTTSITYDIHKRPVQATFADGSIGGLSYDNNDNVVSVVDAAGNTTTFDYDANNNLTRSTDPAGSIVSLLYDGNDRVTSITDRLNNTSSISYDSLGRVASLTDANNNTTTMNYNSRSHLTSVVDALGNASNLTHDLEGVLASVTNPRGHTTSLISDKMGRITRITSPSGFTTDINYDVMGRIFSTTDPLNNTTSLSYDARGLLTGASLPGGAINASYARNTLGQITRITDPNGNDWQHGFDNQGRHTSSTDPLGNTQAVAYDNRNRPQLVTFPGGLGSLTIGYDANNNVTSEDYSDGLSLAYTYDNNNRLLSANGIALTRDANGRITNSNGIAILRDANGRVASMTFATSKNVVYSYDANNRVSQITDWLGGVTTFTYDAAGNLTGIARPNGVNTTKTYDNDNRLAGIAEGTISVINLIRDSKGQTTSATRSVPLTASASSVLGSTDSFDAASQRTTATYDALGRTSSDGGRSYVWNLANQLTSYAGGGGATTATYDAIGKRLSKTSSGVTRSFIWNYALGLASISVERRAASDSRYYIHTPSGGLLYSIDATTDSRTYYFYDEMGNTIFMSDDVGAVIGSYAYSPFGKVLSKTGALDNPFAWQGQFGIMDEGDGLYYIRARFYDARPGRLISRDPVKSMDPVEINPYQYAHDNPLRLVDLNGLDPEPPITSTIRRPSEVFFDDSTLFVDKIRDDENDTLGIAGILPASPIRDAASDPSGGKKFAPTELELQFFESLGPFLTFFDPNIQSFAEKQRRKEIDKEKRRFQKLLNSFSNTPNPPRTFFGQDAFLILLGVPVDVVEELDDFSSDFSQVTHGNFSEK